MKEPKEYICRDCSHSFSPTTSTNKCPKCSSIYLLPFKLNIKPKLNKRIRILFSERLYSLVFGFLAGVLTTYSFLIIAISKTSIAPMASEGENVISVLKAVHLFSLASGGLLGAIGFTLGYDKLLGYLARAWGTEEIPSNRFSNLLNNIPRWVVPVLLTVIIIYAYAQIFSNL